jgi:hypothetical protein
VLSAHLRGLISVIGQSRKLGQREYFQQDSMHHLIARQKSTASLRRKRSESSLVTSVTPSDQRPREEKSAPYRHASYPTLLETLGDSYMDESKLGIADASKALYQNLLKKEYTTPKDTLFREDVFHTACRNLRDNNETRIILDIARLLAPSPETLAAFGAKNLDILVKALTRAGIIVFLSQTLVHNQIFPLALGDLCSRTISSANSSLCLVILHACLISGLLTICTFHS